MKSVNNTLIIRPYINIANLKKHRENVENQQQSTILEPESLNERITGTGLDDILTGGSKDLSLLDSPPIPSNLPPPLIPAPTSKVYKKLDKKRIEAFSRKFNKRLENIVNSKN